MNSIRIYLRARRPMGSERREAGVELMIRVEDFANLIAGQRVLSQITCKGDPCSGCCLHHQRISVTNSLTAVQIQVFFSIFFLYLI